MLEHDLGHERAGLQVAAALELEHVAFGADHGPWSRRSSKDCAAESGIHRALESWVEGRGISHV
jgi:hypothetical protein